MKDVKSPSKQCVHLVYVRQRTVSNVIFL